MSYTIAHLSDSHIGPLPKPKLYELLNKRFTGYVNWRRRARIHDMHVLGRIVDDMLDQRPDHVAMTGDILNLGLPAEFPFARTWLETLGDPQEVSYVPGNHDAYVRSSVLHIGETFAQWCTSDGDSEMEFPYLRERDGIALIGLSSAIPTGPFLASGRLGHEQRDLFAAMLDETGRRGLFRLVMIHHPPWRGGASFGRGLTDAGHFENIIARHGAELIIHGHNHRQMHKLLEGPERRVPVIGVPSASAVPGSHGHRAAYHLYEIEKTGNDWRILVRVRGVQAGDDAHSRAIVETGRFELTPDGKKDV